MSARYFLISIIAALLTGCAHANAPSAWPSRGPFVRVDNPDAFPIYLEARDGLGRAWLWGKINPGKFGCWRWPWALNQWGTITARREGQVSVVGFEVWRPGVHFWHWTPGEDSVRVAQGYCR